MKFPSKPNETERTVCVHAALQEAARYESETAAPASLIAEALARHERSGRNCGRRQPLPLFVASACGLVLLAGIGLWLHMPHRHSKDLPVTGSAAAIPPKPKAGLPYSPALPRLDTAPVLLPPIDMAGWLVSAGHIRHKHWVAHHELRRPLRLSQAQNKPLPARPNCAASVWTTETVHYEVITQTLTPVWVAQVDPAAAAVVLTPALFQLALQPDDASDSAEAQVSAALIPVRFEQENPKP